MLFNEPMAELPPNDEALQTEAWVVNDGFTTARDLGLPYETALALATRKEVLDPSLAIGGDLRNMQAEMVAQILQQPEVLEIPVRSRGFAEDTTDYDSDLWDVSFWDGNPHISNEAGRIVCLASIEWPNGKVYQCERDSPHDGEKRMHAAMVAKEYTNWSDAFLEANPSYRPQS